MKAMVLLRLYLMAITLIFISASCSTPAYKQNKYKKAKRNRDCGCYLQYENTNTMLCINEQK